MGNKVPFDVAMKLWDNPKNDSIYNVDSSGNPCRNRQGYRYNINHPAIRPLYETYKRKIGVQSTIGLTTGQRLNFENLLDRTIEKSKK